jgi:hypothetical protein
MFTRLTMRRRSVGGRGCNVAPASCRRRGDPPWWRLVKLLGDGAMMRLTDATSGVHAALDLVDTMSWEGALSPHAGVHAGSVIERDLDVFGRR